MMTTTMMTILNFNYPLTIENTTVFKKNYLPHKLMEEEDNEITETPSDSA
jgi:hypothetical protein